MRVNGIQIFHFAITAVPHKSESGKHAIPFLVQNSLTACFAPWIFMVVVIMNKNVTAFLKEGVKKV